MQTRRLQEFLEAARALQEPRSRQERPGVSRAPQEPRMQPEMPQGPLGAPRVHQGLAERPPRRN